MTCRFLRRSTLIIAANLAASPVTSAQQKAPQPTSVRVYVFDCGTINLPDITPYQLKKEELASPLMAVPCFLIAHPKGNLMWEVGAVPDRAIAAGGGSGSLRSATSTQTLTAQLAAIGYTPGDITNLSVSHFHYDHVGNANLFAGATWLVRQRERDIMFAEPPSPRTEPDNFSALKNSKAVIVASSDYDVFGDGTVVLKTAAGHSPDHQVLFLKLQKTGPILLSGDLYHYPEERTLHRVPTTEFDAQQTIASRAAIEAFLERARAQLWIEHDFMANGKLRKSPGFYD